MCLESDEASVKTAVDQELLLEFFLAFSRFEYALKASGLFKHHPPDPPRWPKAEPDWDRFAASLRDSFNASATDDLRQACDYMLDSPPNQQVICNDAVAWETPVRPDEETDIQFLLRMVRCVRNNLFHGGKYNIEVHEMDCSNTIHPTHLDGQRLNPIGIASQPPCGIPSTPARRMISGKPATTCLTPHQTNRSYAMTRLRGKPRCAPTKRRTFNFCCEWFDASETIYFMAGNTTLRYMRTPSVPRCF